VLFDKDGKPQIIYKLKRDIAGTVGNTLLVIVIVWILVALAVHTAKSEPQSKSSRAEFAVAVVVYQKRCGSVPSHVIEQGRNAERGLTDDEKIAAIGAVYRRGGYVAGKPQDDDWPGWCRNVGKPIIDAWQQR
jgi:hypothetical protein